MRLLSFACAAGVLLAGTLVADEAGRAIGTRAVQAHGGPGKVARLRVMRIKAEGTATLTPGRPGTPFVIEDWWQMPGRYRTTSRYELDGRTVSQTQVVDGQTGWIETNGQVQDMPREALAEMREQMYAEDMDRLAFVSDPKIEVTSTGETQVGDRPAVGLLLRSPGHRDVRLFFDRQIGRLLKREHPVLDSTSGRLVTQAVVFGDYRETDGVPYCRTLTAFRDGQKVIDAKLVEVQFLTRLDPKLLTRP